MRRANKALETRSSPAAAPAAPYLEPISKQLLAPSLATAVHHVPYEMLTHEAPQEVGDGRMAVEMPGCVLDDMDLPASRSNEQDSLQQEALE